MTDRTGTLLSVVMPNFNHARFIGRALEAVLGQSRAPEEVIVVDDASTDDSVSIIEKAASKDPRIRLVRNERNLGVNGAIGVGLSLAAGKYVHLAAADDYILPGLYEKSLELLGRNPTAGLCSAVSELIDGRERPSGRLPAVPVVESARFIPPAEALALMRRFDSWIMGNTALYRVEALREEGGLREELGPFSDGFLGRVLALKHGACFLPEPLAVWRRLDEGYATGAAGQLENRLVVLGRAAELMRGPYRSLFPEDYVAWWERRDVFQYLNRLFDRERDALRAARAALRRPPLSERAYFACAAALNELERLATKLAVFAMLDPVLRRYWLDRAWRRLQGRPES